MNQQFWQKIEFTDKEFEDLRKVIYKQTGISMRENKRVMLYSRLSKRLRALGIGSFSQYLKLIDDVNQHEEIGHLVNAVTTNLTRFFREDHHYDHMKANILPAKLRSMDKNEDEELLIWSAGCSSGMEAYSAAMVIHEALPRAIHKRTKILATDIDTNMLNRGKDGIYTAEDWSTLPDEYKHLMSPIGKDKKQYQVQQSVRQMVHFKYLNLMHRWPMKKKFDVIFCRNVMIYFDRETRDNLINRYVGQITDDGFIYLGHSESLIDPDVNLKSNGKSIFAIKNKKLRR